MNWIEAQKANGMPCFNSEGYRISVNVGGEMGYPWLCGGPEGWTMTCKTLEQAKAECEARQCHLECLWVEGRDTINMTPVFMCNGYSIHFSREPGDDWVIYSPSNEKIMRASKLHLAQEYVRSHMIRSRSEIAPTV